MQYLIIDGNYMLHRVLYSGSYANNFGTSEGERTGGCYGVLKMLRALIVRFKPDKCVYVWDGGLSRRRKAIFEGYKQKDEDKNDPKRLYHHKLFGDQQNLLNQIFNYLCIHHVKLKNKEGDDICYFLSRALDGSKVIVSDDRDYVLMLKDDVVIYRSMADEMVTLENCDRVVGYNLEDYLFAKAVCGDSSDRIKGVRGIGTKTTTKILQNLNEPLSGGSLYDRVLTLLDALKVKEDRTKKEQAILDSESIVLRNASLMDVSLENFPRNSKIELLEEVEKTLQYNESEFLRMVRHLEFKSILQGYTDWITPFKGLQ